MPGLRQRIAFTAVLLIGVVPSVSRAFTIEECYDAVGQDYANCKAGELYSSFGHCENRRAEGLVSCSHGEYVAPAAKTNVLREWKRSIGTVVTGVSARAGGFRGLQECN